MSAVARTLEGRPRLHWRVPVGPDWHPTDPGRHREALARAIAVEPADGATARTTRQPVVVATGRGASAGDGTAPSRAV